MKLCTVIFNPFTRNEQRMRFWAEDNESFPSSGMYMGSPFIVCTDYPFAPQPEKDPNQRSHALNDEGDEEDDDWY